jgi:hypothetical protein
LIGTVKFAAGPQDEAFGAERKQTKWFRTEPLQERNAGEQPYVVFDCHDPPASRYEFIASAFCHKNFSFGRITLDLLAKAVNMGFERMGGYAGVITPNFF